MCSSHAFAAVRVNEANGGEGRRWRGKEVEREGGGEGSPSGDCCDILFFVKQVQVRNQGSSLKLRGRPIRAILLPFPKQSASGLEWLISHFFKYLISGFAIGRAFRQDCASLPHREEGVGKLT